MSPREAQDAARRAHYDLYEQAERHATFTRRLDAPTEGPWKSYWREAARDLQVALDEALRRLARA